MDAALEAEQEVVRGLGKISGAESCTGLEADVERILARAQTWPFSFGIVVSLAHDISCLPSERRKTPPIPTSRLPVVSALPLKVERLGHVQRPKLGRHHRAWQSVRALKGHARSSRVMTRVKKKDLHTQVQFERHRLRQAVRWHDVMGARRQRLKGAGAWKMWLPAAFLRCGFSEAAHSNQNIATHMRVSVSQVGSCRMAVASLAHEAQQVELGTLLRFAAGALHDVRVQKAPSSMSPACCDPQKPLWLCEFGPSENLFWQLSRAIHPCSCFCAQLS